MVCKDMQSCGPWGVTLGMEEYVLNRWQEWHGLNYAPNMFLRVLVVLVVLIESILPIVLFVLVLSIVAIVLGLLVLPSASSQLVVLVVSNVVRNSDRCVLVVPDMPVLTAEYGVAHVPYVVPRVPLSAPRVP